MNIHEYQAKAILKEYGAPVLSGCAVLRAEDIDSAVDSIEGDLRVVKAQIHAGGRGAGHFKNDPQGGVRLCRSTTAAKQAARAMLGEVLVTKQTGAEGKQVNRLYIESGCAIAQELYFSLLIDRHRGWPVLVCSAEGGVDIETVAAQTPEKIVSVRIDPAVSAMPAYFRRAGYGIGLKGAVLKAFVTLCGSIYRAFIEQDASLIEINPLVVTEDDQLVVLDAKMSLHDNASFRHPEWRALEDTSESDPSEAEAARYDLNYVKLEGQIGCMVNGAGLAMATMDIIKLKGSSPANFLDVGGGATKERVEAAFRLLIADPSVRVVLINIFGGIMRCDIIAEAIVSASSTLKLQVPLMVRLEGTNVEKGKAIFEQSGLAITTAADLNAAAEAAVRLAKG